MLQEESRRGEISYDHSREMGNNPKEYTTLEEALKSPDKVIMLSLNLSNVSKFPEKVYKLKNLEKLRIFGLKDKEIPNGIGQLQHLQDLYISGENLESLPEDFCQLSKLRILEIKGKLKKLPASFGDCSALLNINLEGNSLEYIPENFYKLNKLIKVNFTYNQLLEIPANIKNGLSMLRFFDVSNNQLTVLPESLAQLPALVDFSFFSNMVTEAPLFFKQSSSIKSIGMTMNPVVEADALKMKETMPSVMVEYWN